ncbi:alpha-2,8-sialyltransferase 8F-like isoform X2 [Lissotriton helveticus]
MRPVKPLAWVLVVCVSATVYYTVYRMAQLQRQELGIGKRSEEVREKLLKDACTTLTKNLTALSLTTKSEEVREKLSKDACTTLIKNLTALSLTTKFDEKTLMQDVAAMLRCPWQEDKEKNNHYRSAMKQCCNASDWLIVTQENAHIGQNIVYEAEPNKKINVTMEMFNLFPKTSPISSKSLKSCAVVGSSDILSGSCCGREIDQNDFVIRFNVPPLLNYTSDAGRKVHLITVNPSIVIERFRNLNHRRKAFGDMMQSYGDALIIMPTFSYQRNTEVSFKVQYTLEDFGLASKMVSFHPVYLQKLAEYWKGKGLEALRLSSGLMLVSAALELCDTLTLYGFWPFSTDWKGRELSYHYYDQVKFERFVHAMPMEFLLYSQMHIDGALRLHVGPCF